jgi:hypothetical protein
VTPFADDTGSRITGPRRLTDAQLYRGDGAGLAPSTAVDWERLLVFFERLRAVRDSFFASDVFSLVTVVVLATSASPLGAAVP